MKTIQLLFNTASLVFVLGASAQAHAAGNPCGEPAGVFHEEIDGKAVVSRDIRRFKAGNHYVYSFQLSFQGVLPTQPVPAGGRVFPVAVELNGRSAMAQGQLMCTSVSTEEFDDGKCVEPSESYEPASEPGLFFYAANGEQLNAWDVSVRVLNPVTSRWEAPDHFRFAELNLSTLKWSE